MTRRSRGREVALQLLFWRDANPTAPPEAVERFIRDRLHDPAVEPFARKLFDGVIARQAEIDGLLVEVAENWRLPRMAAVDRNVLRLGVLELLETDDAAPAAVAINEAIELARRYGSADSPAFVNGILDNCRLKIADRKLNPSPEPPPAIDPAPDQTNVLENLQSEI